MLELRELARSIGFGNPRTLLNSGNLVYAAHGKPTEEAAIALEQGILQRMKVSTRVVVITAAELDRIIAKARTRPELTGITTTIHADGQQLLASVDREKAEVLGVAAGDEVNLRVLDGKRAGLQVRISRRQEYFRVEGPKARAERAMELLQGSGALRGTADVTDIVLSCLGSAAAMLARLTTFLCSGARLALRVYLTPDTVETVDAVFAAARARQYAAAGTEAAIHARYAMDG